MTARELLRTLTNEQLLAVLLSDLPAELAARGIPVGGNIIGNYGERIACNTLGLTPARAGTRGYDAVTTDGSRVQIKTRRAGSEQMGNIRSPEYDEVVFISIASNGTVKRALRFPRAVVEQYARRSQHQNALILVVSALVLADPRVVDITREVARTSAAGVPFNESLIEE